MCNFTKESGVELQLLNVRGVPLVEVSEDCMFLLQKIQINFLVEARLLRSTANTSSRHVIAKTEPLDLHAKITRGTVVSQH